MPSIMKDRALAINGGSPVRTRPFADACYASGNERELLLDCFDSHQWSSFRAGSPDVDVKKICTMSSREVAEYDALELPYLGGKYVRQFEARFADYLGVTYAVSANSATSCLVMALGALNLGPGDEILVPTMSFHSTATSILFFNSVPVFVEVKPDTLCIDPQDAEAKITDRTKAIMVAHLGGNAADMDAIMALSRKHNLKVIEDAAQTPGVSYKGRKVGTIGDAGIFSLTETKNITCGEGGLVVTDDPKVAFKARLIRNHGEAVAENTWSDEDLVNVIGMNFRLTELQAAIAVAQLESLDRRNQQRQENASYLIESLSKYPELIPQKVEAGVDYICYILKWRYSPRNGMPDRDFLVKALIAEGIPVYGGYRRLLHENPIFARKIAFGKAGCPYTPPYHNGDLCYGTGVCPRSEKINRELIWFSFIHPPNTHEDMDDVVHAFDKILG